MDQTKTYYRVKNVKTGKFYTGKQVWVKNPNYDKAKYENIGFYQLDKGIKEKDKAQWPKVYELSRWDNSRYEEISPYYIKRDIGPQDIPPWFKQLTTYWSEHGKLFDTRKGAELVMSRLTKTKKSLRANKVDFLLNAPKEAADFKIVPCKVQVVDVESDQLELPVNEEQSLVK